MASAGRTADELLLEVTRQLEELRAERAAERREREEEKREWAEEKRAEQRVAAQQAAQYAAQQRLRRTTMYQPFSSPVRFTPPDGLDIAEQPVPAGSMVFNPVAKIVQQFSTPRSSASVGKAAAMDTATALMDPPRVAVADLVANASGLEQLRKKMKEPAEFSGTDGESAREFCDTARNYVTAFLGSSQIGRLSYIFSRTTGNARQWIKAEMEKAALQHREVEWFELEESFVRAMEGPNHVLKLWTDLQALRYGVGKCKELRDFNLEWDKLRVRIQEGSGEQGSSILWGLQYAQILFNSNQALYDRVVMLGGIPTDLEDWKVKLAMAVSMQTASVSISRTPFTRFSGWTPGRKADAVRVNGVIATDASAAEQPGTDSAVAETADANVITARVSQSSGGNDRRGESVKVRLTQEVLKKLFDANRCFRCYKKGHRGRDCNSTPAVKPPTEEQLSN
jgi:ribosomal protein S6E (S10)